MGPEDVTAEWLSQVLDAEVGIAGTARIGDGLVGMNLRIDLAVPSGSPAPASVVVKLPSPDPTSRATGVALRNYEREVKFYEQIASTVAIRVPRCWHSSWDAASGDFVLVLEDMAPAEPGDQIAGCDAETAVCAVRELARLHGPRWDDAALEELDWLSRRSGPEDTAQLVGLWGMFFPAFVETYAAHLTPAMLGLAERFGPRVGEWLDGRDGPRSVTHGDYRLDNLLFGTSEQCPPVTAVDWQTPGHGSPIGDLSYFCGAGLVPDERRLAERELVDEYLASLGAYVDGVDAEWAWHQYRRDAFAGVIMAVVASQVVGESARSEQMFATMASRHLQHALDLDSLDAI